MRHGHPLRYALGAAFATLVWASTAYASTAAVEAPLPRYALEPGQRLTYDSARVSHNKFYRYDSEGDWTAWVVRRNPDGSYRVLLRAHSKQVSYSKRDESTRDMWDKVWYASVDLFDDGRYIHNPTVGNTMSPNALFPRLPATKHEIHPGWSWTDDHFWSTYELKFDEDARPGVIGFQGRRRMMTDELYDMSRSWRVEFDPSVGFMARSVGTSQKGDGAERSNRGETVFRSVEMIDLDEILALERDVDAFLAAKAAYGKDGKVAEHDLETLEVNLDAARDRFVLATEAIVQPDLVAQAAEIVEAHPKKINYHTSRATHRASLVGKPAPDFSLPDLHGETWSLEAQRGKVVILDFWYRTCTWCVRCMPQIKQLCGDLADEPFIFFGMNTDKVLEDALFVEDAMDLEYPSLQATDVVKDYGVRAFPTMIIIGPDGIVRDVHVGYAEDLREQILEEVGTLLSPAADQ